MLCMFHVQFEGNQYPNFHMLIMHSVSQVSHAKTGTAGPSIHSTEFLGSSQLYFTCMLDRKSPKFEMMVGGMYCEGPGVEGVPVGC